MSGEKRVALHLVKDNFSRYLRQAESKEILITRHGKPAGVLRDFSSQEGWFDYRLKNTPRFHKRARAPRTSLAASQGTKLEDSSG